MKVSAFILPLFLILAIAACKKPTEAMNASTWNEYKNPIISRVLLTDTLSSKIVNRFLNHDVNGVRASYSSGKYTCYFEYEANSKDLIRTISALPFKKSNAISDTTCRKNDFSFSVSGKSTLSQEEIKATSFFWNISPEDYSFYECIKYPTRHTLLINKHTGHVLHRIEYSQS